MTSDTEVRLHAVIAGLGLGLIPPFNIREELRNRFPSCRCCGTTEQPELPRSRRSIRTVSIWRPRCAFSSTRSPGCSRADPDWLNPDGPGASGLTPDDRPPRMRRARVLPTAPETSRAGNWDRHRRIPFAKVAKREVHWRAAMISRLQKSRKTPRDQAPHQDPTPCGRLTEHQGGVEVLVDPNRPGFKPARDRIQDGGDPDPKPTLLTRMPTLLCWRQEPRSRRWRQFVSP